ncbi:hypothetical protein V8G54_006577 [Vigna mungo]|uniref:Uncharacterized protein n=1 Tax=Vigna mungo TaxID=3915 RepID=A0AAQ3P1L7_VIGMU
MAGIAVNKSGLKPDLTIQYTSSKDFLGNPFPAYAEIIMFQTTRSLSGIFSNSILASSRLPNFAYIDNSAVFTASSSHRLLTTTKECRACPVFREFNLTVDLNKPITVLELGWIFSFLIPHKNLKLSSIFPFSDASEIKLFQ